MDHRSRHGLAIPLLLAGLLTLLTGCGQVASAPLSNASAAPTPTATTHPGGPAAHGCVAQPPANASTFHPDVAVTQGENQTVTLASGQRLEIRLGSTIAWNLATADSGPILIPILPEGWLDAATAMCVWHFTAGAVGHTQLVFHGTVLCKPGVHCPAVAELATFEVTVH